MPEPADSSTSTRARPFVVGLLGGIASGKSAVARALAGTTGVVVDADALAHEVLDSAEVRARIAEEFGPDVVDAEGRVDRVRLGAIVFRDPARRARLESWIHPRVRAMIAAALGSATERGAPLVVLDVPLLLENDASHGLVAACDALVFVDAPLAERERRASTRGWPVGELVRREAAQWPLAEKARRADHVLVNDGTIDELARAAHDLRERLLAGRG